MPSSEYAGSWAVLTIRFRRWRCRSWNGWSSGSLDGMAIMLGPPGRAGQVPVARSATGGAPAPSLHLTTIARAGMVPAVIGLFALCGGHVELDRASMLDDL